MPIVKVRCENAIHGIALLPHGKIRLCDHDAAERRAQLAAHALGGEMCRCFLLWQLWKERNLSHESQWLHSRARLAARAQRSGALSRKAKKTKGKGRGTAEKRTRRRYHRVSGWLSQWSTVPATMQAHAGVGLTIPDAITVIPLYVFRGRWKKPQRATAYAVGHIRLDYVRWRARVRVGLVRIAKDRYQGPDVTQAIESAKTYAKALGVPFAEDPHLKVGLATWRLNYLSVRSVRRMLRHNAESA